MRQIIKGVLVCVKRVISVLFLVCICLSEISICVIKNAAAWKRYLKELLSITFLALCLDICQNLSTLPPKQYVSIFIQKFNPPIKPKCMRPRNVRSLKHLRRNSSTSDHNTCRRFWNLSILFARLCAVICTLHTHIFSLNMGDEIFAVGCSGIFVCNLPGWTSQSTTVV